MIRLSFATVRFFALDDSDAAADGAGLGATAGLGSLTADKVVVRDEDGVIPAKKYDLEIRDGKLFVNLTHGMAILLR